MRISRLAAITALVLSVTGAIPLAASAQATATDLYVDNSSAQCSDTSPSSGSQAAPFCSILAASKIVQPDQTVHIGGGAYNDEELDLTRSGTPGAPIVFTGVAGVGTPQIGGSRQHAFSLTGVHDVKLQNLNLAGTQDSVLVTGSSQVTLDRLTVSGAGSASTAATGYPGLHITGQSSNITVSRSRVSLSYSDGVVVDPGVSHAVITTNMITRNHGHGVSVTGAPGSIVTSNSIGNDCGPGIELAGDSSGSTVENNLVMEGRLPNTSVAPCPTGSPVDLMVSPASTAGTKADYNIVTSDTATPYTWLGQTYADVTSFQKATGQGAHDILAPAGAQFWKEGSPTIDSADALAPGELDTDIKGKPRVDDPLKPNTGTGVGYYDRGAVEWQDPLATSSSAAPSNVSGHPFDVSVSGSITSPWSAVTTSSLDFGDGSTPVSTPTFPVTHTYPGPGTYTVTLTATDAQGTTSTQTATATVQPVGAIQPVLGVSRSQNHTLHVTATAAGTVSPWLSSTYTFDFGDGTPATVSNGPGNPTAVTHDYPAPGNYTVTETVQDDHGRSAATTQRITVGSAYVPVAPTRILDTRTGVGAPTGAVGAGQVLKLQVAGRGGVPADGKVTAVLLNLTATQATDDTHVTAYPGGAVPNVSNLNVTAGHDTGNAVLVPVAADGTVSLYHNSGSVHLVADVQGYYTTSTDQPAYNLGTVTQNRVLDTRYGTGAPASKVGPGGTVKVKLVNWVPATAKAVVLNLTATNGTDSSHITAAPNGNPPTNSSLNFAPGETVANQVTVPIDPDGTITLYNNSGSVDLIADVQGYYADQAAGTQPILTTTPTRLLDTRDGTGGINQKLGPDSSLRVKVRGIAGVPDTATNALVNLTATNPTDESWISAFNVSDSWIQRPFTSNVNVTPGATVPNLVLVHIDSDGYIEVYNHSGSTDVIVDLQGYTA